MRRSPVPAWIIATLLVSACAEPPNKEMGQAQGAIDAARAAGAERYAAEEFAAATAALKQSNDAVAQGDYRLALNHALESREHAQDAARLAADTGSRVRGGVERTMAEVAALLAEANTRLAAAEEARANARTIRPARQALAQVNADVQKAGAAMKAEDYGAAQTALNGVREAIQKVIEMLPAAPPPQAARRRR
jgi:hypothetical protein